jgi:glycosyltransferase involved in cell wall biosynthesis
MKIGLLIAFAGRNTGGPVVWERKITRELVEFAPHHEYHLYCLDRRAPDVIGLSSGNFVYHLLKPSARVLSMLTSLPRAIARTKPDVFHGLTIPPPFASRGIVMTMACASLMRNPELYPPLVRMRLQFLLHRAVPKAAKVVCPSEHVRDVTMERFRLPADRLAVIPLGVDSMFHPIKDGELEAVVHERYGIRFPYFLFSGRWEQRKNIIRTLEAFALFKRTTRSEHRLVMTGDNTWAAEEAAATISRLGIREMVIDLGNTPWSDLPYLYSGAEAVMYASLWEGFGLPIIESMACGTPVITANITAMPETAGNAALLVDPYSVEDIANAMHRIVSDAELRGVLRARGLERARMFTWDKTVRKTLDVYEEVARNGEVRARAM